MKNLKSVSAAILLAISFTACEKNDLLPTPARPPAAERQGSIILPVWNLQPTEIRDASGNLEKKFTYDTKNHIKSLFTVGEELLTFQYSSNGRLERINHFPSEAAENANSTSSFDIMYYENENINKPSSIMRYGNGGDLNSEITKQNPTSRIEINYNRNLNKVSEIEYTLLGVVSGKGIVKEHRYTYDTKGNVTSVSFYEAGAFKGMTQYKLFDNFNNTLKNVPEINMIPFAFAGVNNATFISGSGIAEKAASGFTNGLADVQKKFLYNDYGFPETETTITQDGSYSVNIKYSILK